MNVMELMQSLTRRGIRFSLEGDQLKTKAPKDAMTSEVIAQIGAHKAAIIAFLKSTAAGQARGLQRPVRRGADARAVLSAQQRSLWSLHKIRPGMHAYNIPVAFELHGALDVARLVAALRMLYRRHDALRTRFVEDVAGCLAVVDAVTTAAPVTVEACAREAVADALAAECVRVFDLAAGPLFLARVLVQSPREHVLLVNMHHIISDGGSIAVFFSELSALYAADGAFAEADVLAPLPIEYGDYAHWQAQRAASVDYAAALDYWRQALGGAPALLELPLDFARPAMPSMRGRVHRFALDEATSDALRALAAQHGCTPYITLLAAFNVLLHRYSRQEDIVVGSPTAHRELEELQGLIGYFVNPVALRTVVSGSMRFVDLLAAVRATVLGAFEHQHVAFADIIEAVRPERSLGHSPLFQVLFSLQEGVKDALSLPGLDVRACVPDWQIAKFDLSLIMTDDRCGPITGGVEYSEDLFAQRSIELMAQAFECLLRDIVARPQAAVGDYRLHDDAQHRQLLGWSGRRHDPDDDRWNDDRCIHQRFQDQVQARPDAVALVLGDERLTYTQLDARANRIAHRLRRSGVGPQVRVGLCVERSFEMLVGVLAILKAGGAYVPLDPRNPQSRLRYILDDAAVDCVLTESTLLSLLESCRADGRELLLLDNAAAFATEPASVPPVHNQCADDLAYVIYTSGSTGNPKGVLVSHRNVVRLFAAADREFRFSHDDVWTLFHSFAFDFSVWEIWGALFHGGRLVVVPYAVSRSPQDFHSLVLREGVTVLNQTPSAFYPFSDVALRDGRRTALRYIVFGGEALDFKKVSDWLTQFGDRQPRLVNMYGITETTVHVTCREITCADGQAAVSMIGKPLADLTIHVCDERLNLVPIGVPGELCVGGAGLARGYHNQPELTGRRFVPDPFAGDGARLYRSGDLVRWLPNGDLVYLGRIDQQVKVRGFRIELGEIEAQLLVHDAVNDAIVLARSDLGEEAALVAYVVFDGDPPVDAAMQLRARLLANLPDYMVPARYVVLERFPLTVNGKIDRAALPAPSLEAAGEYMAPATPTQQAIAQLWGQVLNLDAATVGAGANFFALGGTSLSAIQMTTSVSARFGLAVNTASAFQFPVLADYATCIEAMGADTGEADPEHDVFVI